MELTVTNLDDRFSSLLLAYVLDNIAGDNPAIPWTELNKKWPHLCHVPFGNVSRRRQADVMIGSDHPAICCQPKKKTTSPEQWRHIPGTLNPADLPTRGLSVSDLAESDVWMEGPTFLKDDESTWPAVLPLKDNAGQTSDCERRTKTRTHMTKSSAS